MIYYQGDSFYYDNSSLKSTSLVYGVSTATGITTVSPTITATQNYYQINNLVYGVYTVVFKTTVDTVVKTIDQTNFSVYQVTSKTLADMYARRDALSTMISNLEDTIITQANDPSGMSVSKMELTQLTRELDKISTRIFHYNRAIAGQSIISL